MPGKIISVLAIMACVLSASINLAQENQQLPAQPPPGLGPVKGTGVRDPEAERVLKKMSDKFKRAQSYQAEFTLTMDIPESDQNEVRQGKLYVSGEKYRFEMDGVVSISDGKTQWQYNKESNEVYISNYEPQEQVFEPRDLFALYKEDFYYILEGEKKFRDKVVYVITLVPVNKNESYFKIKLYVDKKEYIPARVIVYEKSGVRYYLDLQSFIPGVPLPDMLFTFDPSAYPGITVIDTRE